MSAPCFFCGNPVNPFDLGTWKQISSWVKGPKANGACLSENTDLYAHDPCVRKAKSGQPPEQGTLFEEKV
jgi:hypothetical protein